MEQRAQYSIVLKSQSGGNRQLAADNFLGTLVSYVGMAYLENKPGQFLEWVREDSANLVNIHFRENVSNLMLDGSDDSVGNKSPNGRRTYLKVPGPIVVSDQNLSTATTTFHIRVDVNNKPASVESIDGTNGIVQLRVAPPTGSIIRMTWLERRLADSGLYYITLEDENGVPSDSSFMVDRVKMVTSEIVIDATGGETTATLAHIPIEKTLRLYRINNVVFPSSLYSVDYSTGTITFNDPLEAGQSIVAAYRYYDTTLGPFEYHQNTCNSSAISGVILAFGRKLVPGDKAVVVITSNRGEVAQMYGGRWTMSLSMDVIAQDSIQQEEITDSLVEYIWIQKKPRFDAEGITITNINPGSDSTDVYDETGNFMYFVSSVDVDVETDWESYIHLPVTLSGFDYLEIPGGLDYGEWGVGGLDQNTLTDEEMAAWPSFPRPVDRLPVTSLRKSIGERIA